MGGDTKRSKNFLSCFLLSTQITSPLPNQVDRDKVIRGCWLAFKPICIGPTHPKSPTVAQKVHTLLETHSVVDRKKQKTATEKEFCSAVWSFACPRTGGYTCKTTLTSQKKKKYIYIYICKKKNYIKNYFKLIYFVTILLEKIVYMYFKNIYYLLN